VLRLQQDARGRHKLTPPWEGPFVIAKVLKPGTYKLANSQGLQQRLEHPTATSLLPLRCFQVVRTPRPHTKSNHQGRFSLASAKPDPSSGARRGNPLCIKIFLEKSLPSKRLSRLPAISVTGPQETNKGACKWQGRPSRGAPTPLGYGYLTRCLP
jgi:hypothetical protein